MRGCDKAKKQTGPLFRHLCLLCHYYISFFQSEQELLFQSTFGNIIGVRRVTLVRVNWSCEVGETRSIFRLALNSNDYFRLAPIH